MTDSKAKATISVIATTSSRVNDLVVKNGQLIFIQDKGNIAFDFNDKRVFYNQIEEIATEYERSILSPSKNGYYFVIETAVLWAYYGFWIQITNKPDEIKFVGIEGNPELGKANTLYVDKVKKEISIWDEEQSEYSVVADKTEIDSISSDDIGALFL